MASTILGPVGAISALMGISGAGAFGKGPFAPEKAPTGKGDSAEAERERRRKAAEAADTTGRRSTLLAGDGGPQPAASRVTLLGGS